MTIYQTTTKPYLKKNGAGSSKPYGNGKFYYVAGKVKDENAIRKAAVFLYQTAKNYSYTNAILTFSESNCEIENCRIAELVSDAFFMKDYKYDFFKKDESVKLEEVTINLEISETQAQAIIDKNTVITKGVNLVRDMVNALGKKFRTWNAPFPPPWKSVISPCDRHCLHGKPPGIFSANDNRFR